MLSFPPRKGGIPLAWRWLAGRLPGRLAGRLVGRLPEVGREAAGGWSGDCPGGPSREAGLYFSLLT